MVAHYPVFHTVTEVTAPGGEPALDLATRIGRPPEAVYAFLADVRDAEPIPRRATDAHTARGPERLRRLDATPGHPAAARSCRCASLDGTFGLARTIDCGVG